MGEEGAVRQGGMEDQELTDQPAPKIITQNFFRPLKKCLSPPKQFLICPVLPNFPLPQIFLSPPPKKK